jgi:hypothetical protein
MASSTETPVVVSEMVQINSEQGKLDTDSQHV